jgi:hypothetical protein
MSEHMNGEVDWESQHARLEKHTQKVEADLREARAVSGAVEGAGEGAREALARVLSKSRAPNWWDGDEPATFSDLDGMDRSYAVPDDEDYNGADAILASPWILVRASGVVAKPGGAEAEVDVVGVVARVIYDWRPVHRPGTLDPMPWEVLGNHVTDEFRHDARTLIAALSTNGMLR